MSTVYKVVTGNACGYIRAVSAANARIRAYKALGMQGATVHALGHQTPDIGERGYTVACHTVDAIRTSAPMVTPKAYSMPKNAADKISNKGLALAKFLGLAI